MKVIFVGVNDPRFNSECGFKYLPQWLVVDTQGRTIAQFYGKYAERCARLFFDDITTQLINNQEGALCIA